MGDEAAVAASQELDDRTGFTERPRRQHKGVVLELHQRRLSGAGRAWRAPARPANRQRCSMLDIEVQPDAGVELTRLGPVFLDLDGEKEVHGPSEHLAELGSRRLADPPERLAALAEHDRALALALDVYGLLDAKRLALGFGEGSGLNGGGVGQLVVQAQVDLLSGNLG